MDTQRLILFVIFSFSVLMLWDAWQRDQRPEPAPQAQAQKQGVPAPAAAAPAPGAAQAPRTEATRST